MASIAQTTERELPYGRWLAERGPQANNQYHAPAFGAVGGVYQLGLRCIVSPTNTGATAGLISAYRRRRPCWPCRPTRRSSAAASSCGRPSAAPRGAARHARPDRGVRPGGRARGLRADRRMIGITAGLPAAPAGPTSRSTRSRARRGAARERPWPSRCCRRTPSCTSGLSGSSTCPRRPTALAARARLELLPAAVLHGGRHDRHQPRDRTVHAHRVGHELGIAARDEPDADPARRTAWSSRSTRASSSGRPLFCRSTARSPRARRRPASGPPRSRRRSAPSARARRTSRAGPPGWRARPRPTPGRRCSRSAGSDRAAAGLSWTEWILRGP